MPGEIIDIAARILELREICDFTREEMAEKLNIPMAKYIAYETGEKDIPISVLLNVAEIFGVEPAALLTGKEPKLSVYCLTRAGQGVGVERNNEYRYQSLAYNMGGKIAEPYVVTVGAVPAGTPIVLNSHEGQEFDYVIEGTIRFLVNGTELILNPGDSLYFKSIYPHGMQAVGTESAKFLAVVL